MNYALFSVVHMVRNPSKYLLYILPASEYYYGVLPEQSKVIKGFITLPYDGAKTTHSLLHLLLLTCQLLKCTALHN